MIREEEREEEREGGRERGREEGGREGGEGGRGGGREGRVRSYLVQLGQHFLIGEGLIMRLLWRVERKGCGHIAEVLGDGG